MAILLEDLLAGAPSSSSLSCTTALTRQGGGRALTLRPPSGLGLLLREPPNCLLAPVHEYLTYELNGTELLRWTKAGGLNVAVPHLSPLTREDERK